MPWSRVMRLWGLRLCLSANENLVCSQVTITFDDMTNNHHFTFIHTHQKVKQIFTRRVYKIFFIESTSGGGVRLWVVVVVVMVASTWIWISWLSQNQIHSAFSGWTEECKKVWWTNECLLVDFVFQCVHRTHVEFRLVNLCDTGVWKLSMVTNAGVALSSI